MLFLTSFSGTFKARTGVTMLSNVHSTSVLRFDCKPGRYPLFCSGIRRRSFIGTSAGFDRPEGVNGGFTHDLRSKRRTSSEYPLQLHGVHKKSIEAGERFDVTMITTEAIEDLVKQGKLAGDSKMSIGRSELGIGIKSGVSKPDIKTVDGLKKALLEVRSITYPQDGASRGYI